MSIKHIKIILIVSMLWIMITQMLLVVIYNNNSFIFYILTLLGEIAFLLGLIFLDKHAKSSLSSYYMFMLCISIMLYLLRYFEIINPFMSLALFALFLFALYKHLQIFTNISGQALFVRSFYVLLFCVIVGFVALICSDFIRSPQIFPFVFGAMVLPALFTYLVALFSLQHISLARLHKVII